MPPVAERHRSTAEIDTDHAARLEVARNIGGAAATAAADLQHVAPGEWRQGRDMTVERDWIALGLVVRLQVERPRRAVRLGIAVVHQRPPADVAGASRDHIEEEAP